MKLFLVRHGTTEWMEIKRLHGSADSPLSEKGRFQAQQAGMALKDSGLDYVFCSPQGRAQETAGYIARAAGIELQPQEWLREMHFGIHEGSMHSIYRFPVRFIRRPIINLLHLVDTERYGESWKTVSHRVAEGWQQLLDQGIDGRVALVSHSLVLECLFNHLMQSYGIPTNGRPDLLKPASISEYDIDIAAGSMRIVRYSDVSHYKNNTAQ